MNIFKKLFGKKEVIPDLTPKQKVYTVELEFHGPNNKLVKLVHKNIVEYRIFIPLDNGFLVHRFEFADGGKIVYRDFDGYTLTKVEQKVE